MIANNTITTVPLTVGGKRKLTHSAESAFHACPRRYQLLYVRNLRPMHDGDALRLGSAVHLGLEWLKNNPDPALSLTDRTAGAWSVIDAEYAERCRPPWLTDDEYDVERHTARALVAGWAWRYPANDGLTYVAAEIGFRLPLRNPATGRPARRFQNAGKIDAIARLADGRLALVEHKTCSDDIGPDSDYWRRLTIDAQISRYWNAAHQIGHKVETVLFDVIRKPGIRPKRVANADRHLATVTKSYFTLPLDGQCPEHETPAMYGARLLNDLMTRPDYFYQRREIPRLASDLRDFARDSWSTMKAIEACDKDGYYPRATNACTSPYRCAFLEICRGVSGGPDEVVPIGFRRLGDPHPELSA